MEKRPDANRPLMPPHNQRRWVRRRIIVDPEFQYRMLVPIAVFAAIQTLVLGLLLFYPLYRNTVQAPDQFVQAILYDQLVYLQVCFWTTFALAATLSSLYTLTRSNRVAGPLYKLREGLLRISDGEFRNLRFRNDDELRDFEPIANRLADKMAALASDNARRMTQLGTRIEFLKRRLEMQQLSRAEVECELTSILMDFSQVHILREHA